MHAIFQAYPKVPKIQSKYSELYNIFGGFYLPSNFLDLFVSLFVRTVHKQFLCISVCAVCFILLSAEGGKFNYSRSEDIHIPIVAAAAAVVMVMVER